MAEPLAVEGELKSLADKLDRLLSTNARLHEENLSLRYVASALAADIAVVWCLHEGRPALVLTALGHEDNFPVGWESPLAKAVREAAAAVSHRLGHRG